MEIKWEKQSSRIVTPRNELQHALWDIEDAARACYESESSERFYDAYNKDNLEFVKKLLKRGHESPIEFGRLHVVFRTSRAIANEVVRHRLFSFCQSSTRYINHAKRNEISFILPDWADGKTIIQFEVACVAAANAYKSLIESGCTPQEARDVLPLTTATTLHVSGNFREWRHFFKLRTDKAAHPEMQALANGLLEQVLNVKGMEVIFGEYSK